MVRLQVLSFYQHPTRNVYKKEKKPCEVFCWEALHRISTKSILQALVARSLGRNGFQVRHYDRLWILASLGGQFKAASRPPIVVKWYYEGSTSALEGSRGLRKLRPSTPRAFGFLIVILHFKHMWALQGPKWRFNICIQLAKSKQTADYAKNSEFSF